MKLDKYKINLSTSLVLSIMPLLVSLFVHPFIPSKIPMHYNSAGEITRWGGSWELILMGLVFSVIALIMCMIFAKNKIAEKNKIIGFIGADIMAATFIILQIVITIKGNNLSVSEGLVAEWSAGAYVSIILAVILTIATLGLIIVKAL